MFMTEMKGTKPMAPPDDLSGETARWHAVETRDAAADGRFVFAVRSTGIYCKPSCAARRAKRENVSFYDTPEAARSDGFRACKRCRPDEAATDSLAAQAVTAAARMIDRALATEEPVPGLEELAARAGFSMYHFHRLFRKTLGVTPKAYASAARAGRMREELAASGSVTEAIYGAGYSSSSRFYETAAGRLGMRPATHRDGGRGETIRYAVSPCSLGLVLVAATPKGVCAIQFGDEGDSLVAGLKARFPQAAISDGDAGFAAMVADVVALVENPGLGHAVPLDVRGTAFQERVWQALRAVPAGRTASYAEIAEAIGQPRAVRGVAQACAANPAAVAIPCHRIVRSDGTLSGYRWGAKRKAELLKREGVG
jgi:AraC family transcriptional regulator of adaptative response/methylated-DNA-[protein]-cysteine methyltransferase